MSELNLEEAAKYLGVPPGVLHIWAWTKFGPRSSRSYWFPTFTQERLNEYLVSEGIDPARPYIEKQPIVAIGTKRIKRFRNQRR